MIYAAILAGGKGSRMGNTEKPKQYLPLCGKPIIAYTVEKFFIMPDFDKILVLCPESWIETTRDVLRKEFGDNDKIVVTQGGADRNETIANALDYIEKHYGIDEDTIICTHDSVRPFVTYKIIKNNLEAMTNYDACDTVIPATDTIVESKTGSTIDAIPNRSFLYQGQTPQTFKAKQLKTLQESISDENRSTLTDACKIFTLQGKPVALVQGSTLNMKITYASDLLMAESLLGMES